MKSKPPSLSVVSCIVERSDGETLICSSVAAGETARRWEFPSGIKEQNELYEAAMRRVCLERVGLTIDIHTGQPPLQADFGGSPAIYRFFRAFVLSGEAQPIDYEEVRWVRRGQLCEYDFAEAYAPVVEWYTQ